MRLDDLCGDFQRRGFPAKGELTHPDRALINEARSSVEAALIGDEFLADCIAGELTLIESGRLRRGLVPFFTAPDPGIRFAFGYWAPGDTAGAHEHTAWTITAVCRNQLDVLTYNRDETYRTRQLVQKNRFQAAAGRVGYIFEPSIHEPRNLSPDWSLSLHITSPRDGERPDDYREPLPVLESKRQAISAQSHHPYTRVVATRRRNQCVHQLARTLAGMNLPQTSPLLDRCFTLGSAPTRQFIDRVRPRPSQPHALLPQGILVRTDATLVLRHRRDGDMVVLEVETPGGFVEEFALDEMAYEAMAFVTRENMFEPRALPGDLTDDERISIAEALEQTGLFTRMDSSIRGMPDGVPVDDESVADLLTAPHLLA